MSTSHGNGEALLVLDTQLIVRAANRAFYGMFRLAPEECVGQKVYELGGRAWDEKLRTMLEAGANRIGASASVAIVRELGAD